MIKVAMLSFWHVHARDYARQASEHPDTQIVAVWDEIPERGREEAEARGARFYESLQDLLADPEIDAVIVDTPTRLHKEVIVAAAEAGKHIFTEKVIAPSLLEANEILAAVRQAGVRFTISLPRLYTDYTGAFRKIVEQGLLGQITLIRARLSHSGGLSTEQNPEGWLPDHFYNAEQCGGGAMIDLGCHPMYLTRLLLGMPESVSATYGYVTGREVEDNAVSVLQYKNGAVGIVEAGFVNPHSPFVLEVHGTSGSLLYSEHDLKLLVRSTLQADGGGAWEHRANLPTAQPSAFDQWVEHILQGAEEAQGELEVENVQLAMDLTRLMEASNLSASRREAVRIDSLKA
ncbi:Gfo/Idh/MocA family protein [Paenibacillus eucommiae]|uniref:Dehydrogenase n=1 Tax=Paenibacillus eucommiae TaxID=1355755 RepID=A0ABS4J7P8_9BACL|nr:Gfo/Idh/MocA family oxidoreductase [Paenibacillus eucommiae]MBP1995874.1 putative dehydrogenase [Paenibacillus eucommiae]